MSNKVVPLNILKISKGDKEKLSEHYIFRMQTIDDMPEEDTAAIRTHQDNQKSLSSINNHHSDTLDIPKHALSSCPTHVDLDDYVYPNLDPATAT